MHQATRAGETTRRRGPQVALVAALLALAAGAAVTGREAPAPPLTTVAGEARLMGTRWAIEAVPPPGSGQGPVDLAIAESFAEVSRVEGLASEWRPETPLSAINAAAGGAPVEVPAELVELLRRGLAMSERSGGAFDITWRGLGPLWDLRAEPFLPPSDEAIAAARARVGYRRLRIDGRRVGLVDPGMSIGLGAIAKGYAVDRAAAVLERRGITSYFVDGGGDVLVRGRRGPRPWRVGIRDPRGGPDALLAVVESEGGAVVTSGDYERARVVDGVRYHHILDPRTGRPATGCRSVTIVAPAAETADALATAVFVLGPTEGLALVASEPGAEALIVDAAGQVVRTPGFPAGGDDAPGGLPLQPARPAAAAPAQARRSP